MDSKYAAWIEEYVAAQPDRFVRGKCVVATNAMVLSFTELRRAKGFVHCAWGRDQHVWCVAPDGSIVDPTKSQFPIVVQYEELDLNDPNVRRRVPTGVCADCGDDVYEDANFCSDRCERATLAYLNSGRF